MRTRFVFSAGVLALLLVRTVVAVGIDSVAAELVRPGVYRIDFEPNDGAGAVAIFASSQADRIDSASPLTTAYRAPVEVSVGDRAGRVYFHLKPAHGPTRVVSVRRLPLEGASNFRDLGGYPAAGGKHVKWGVIYQSNHLTDLTTADYRYLEALGIHLVCDFRTAGERERAPTRWAGAAPSFLWAPVLTEQALSRVTEASSPVDFQRRVAEAQGPTDAQLSMAYERFVVDNPEPYSQLLHHVVAGDMPAVFHCTAGRDRTGVGAAILLTALGVPWDVVVQDYLLTDRYWLDDKAVEQRRMDVQKTYSLPALPDAAAVRALYRLHAETMEATFATIRKAYGSFEKFLGDKLKMSPEDLAQLRARLLE